MTDHSVVDASLDELVECSQDAFPWLEEQEVRGSASPRKRRGTSASNVSNSQTISKFSDRSGSESRTGISVTSRDEMNLAEFPLTVLSTRTNPHIKTLEFRDSQRLKTGELVEREWIITGADKFGLPTSTDDDVVLGLMCLSMETGFRERKVHFTRYELLKILRWSTEGRSYSRLTKSLDRLSGVRIRATNAFFDNSLKAYQTVNFGIIDAYEINDERSERDPSSHEQRRHVGLGRGEKIKSFFVWSDLMFDSFKNGFIKKIDLDLYFHLRSAVARRLYRYLDKHFYYRDTLERPLMTLAFEKLGLSRTYKYVSSVKQQLEPALDELIEANFLAGYEFINRGGVHLVKFYSQRAVPVEAVSGNQTARPTDGNGSSSQYPSGNLIARQENPTAPFQRSARSGPFENSTQDEKYVTSGSSPADSSQSTRMATALVARGLSRHQIEKLFGKDGAQSDSATRAIEYFDWLKTNKKLSNVKNLPGFLFRLIEEPSRIPEVWQSNATQHASEKPQNRPELRVVRAERTKEVSYAQVDPERIQEFKERLTDEERLALYARVEEKITCLKGVLTRERFKEAVEGCVNEEISKMLREFPLFSMTSQR